MELFPVQWAVPQPPFARGLRPYQVTQAPYQVKPLL